MNKTQMILSAAVLAVVSTASLAEVTVSREERMDLALKNYRDGTGNDTPGSKTDRAADSVKHGAKKTGHAIEHGAKKTGNAIEHGAKKTGHAVGTGVEKTGAAIERGGEKIQNSTKP